VQCLPSVAGKAEADTQQLYAKAVTPHDAKFKMSVEVTAV
jgi:hypothetical protein